MTPPFFLVAADQLRGGADPGTIELDGPEGHHAVNVRRLKVGEALVLTDGAGHAASGTVSQISKAGSLAVAIGQRWFEPQPLPVVTVVQALIKGDRMDRAIEQLTEVGVDRVMPWSAANSVVQWRRDSAPSAVDKLRRKALEAAKQARRVRVPTITDLANTEDVLGALSGFDLAIALDESSSAALAAITGSLPGRIGNVCLLVGPEGGITTGEREQFQAAGAVAARMGPTVMRAGTAAVAATTWLMGISGRWATADATDSERLA